MFFQRINVAPSQRVIITSEGKLDQVLMQGSHLIMTLGKQIKVHNEDIKTLNVTWPGIQNALRFEEAQVKKYWQIIRAEEGQVTIAWHKHLPAQAIIGEGAQAFWQPDNEEIATHTFPQDEFWLPEEVQKSLLLQHEVKAPLKKFTVNAEQKLIIVVHGELKRILDAGEYVLYINEQSTLAMPVDSRDRMFSQPALITTWEQQQPEIIAQYFDCIEASNDEIALCSYNGLLQSIVLPGTKRHFWKNAKAALQVQHVSLTDGLQVAAPILAQLNAIDYQKHPIFANCVTKVEVPENHQAILTIDHKTPTLLNAGNYCFWSVHKPINWQLIDLRLQACEISGQELLTEDKVTIRINASCNYHVTDSQVWVSRYADPTDYLYRELQFAVRAIVGSKNIDTLLSDKQGVDVELEKLMKQKNIQGIEIDAIGIKDIILPGEIRDILSKVVEAEKSAQANNIRRREETAATRSLLNTARVMEENPTALRLKELETLERVTEKIDNISVYGGLDGVLNGLIHIQPQAGDAVKAATKTSAKTGTTVAKKPK